MNILAAVAAAYAFAQLAKVLVFSVRSGTLAWKVVFLPGGMPSAHSALVASIILSVFLEEGPAPLFFVTLIFGMIVMYDAMTLRREVGAHRALLDRLHLRIEKKAAKTLLEKDHIGHTPLEVFVGMLIGLAIPLVIYYA